MSYLCADRYSAYVGLNPAATASRNGGVAPLSVFFDATATVDALTARPFHDLLYIWNFGDGSAGTWARDSSSQNVAYGPCAAHVYESAGTFNVTLTVFNGYASKTIAVDTVTVTVADTVYSTTNTICFSTAGNFTGKPTGATEITDATGDFDAAINTYLAQGKRLLFRTAENWTTSAAAVLDSDGPWTIGTFGGATPANVARTAGTSIFTIGSGSTAGFSDGRVMNLALDGASASIGFTGAGPMNDLLIYQCTAANVTSGLSCPGTAGGLSTVADIWDGMCVYECDFGPMVGGGGGVGIFGTYTRFACLGTTVDDATAAEFPIRFMWLNKAVLSQGFAYDPASTKGCIALRAPDWDTGLGVIPANTPSQYVVVSDYTCRTAAGVQNAIQVGGDGADDSRNRDHIIEKVLIQCPAGTTPLNPIKVVSSEEATPVTVRNVIGTFGAATAAENCIDVGAIGVIENCSGVRVYNNSFYSGDATTTFRTVRFNTTTNSIAINNAGYAPNATSALGYVNNGSTGTTENDNSTDSEVKNTSPYTDTTPADPAAGEFDPANYAVSGGDNTVPVFDDYLSTRRGYGNTAPTMSVGAIA